jgi:hypothetical protein
VIRRVVFWLIGMSFGGSFLIAGLVTAWAGFLLGALVFELAAIGFGFLAWSTCITGAASRPRKTDYEQSGGSLCRSS